MFFLVLRHPACYHVLHECVVGCPILSSMYEHVPIYHRGVGIEHSLRSNFAPSRPLQLWFEAACEASLARDKYAMQSTPKIRRGRYSFIVCLFVLSSWMIGVRDKISHVLTRSFFGIC